MPKIERLDYIDAMRALALFGILFVHSHDHFNLEIAQFPRGGFDYIADTLYSTFFVSRAFMLFSLLFGISFALQLMRSEERGYDFRGRFLWRLCLLFCFGVVHSFFYCGDILIIFAVLGLIPLALWKLPSRVLMVLALLMLLCPSAIYNDVMGQPDILYRWYTDYCRIHEYPKAPQADSSAWTAIAWWNITVGFKHAWLYMIWSNRLSLVIGMFLLGAALGKSRWVDLKVYLHGRVALALLALYVLLFILFKSEWVQYLPSTVPIWLNVTFVLLLASSSSCLLRWNRARPYLKPLCSVGRMTLTCYISQSLIMTSLLASWGCGFLMKFNRVELAITAVILYLVQMLACTLWLRYFSFGPLEALWRKLTNIGR